MAVCVECMYWPLGRRAAMGVVATRLLEIGALVVRKVCDAPVSAMSGSKVGGEEARVEVSGGREWANRLDLLLVALTDSSFLAVPLT